MTLLTNWTESHTQSFQKDIMSFGHDLNSTGLFTDDALIALLDKHPSHMLDVCTMGDPNHALYPNKFRTGDFRDAGGKVILDAAKAGKVWVNVRRAMNVHPEYKEVLDAMYAGISERTGNKAFNANGGILISSPVAKVPYHFDKTETILWHIRGQKTMYLYPLTPDFIPDRAYEAAVSNALEDDLPYTPEFDASATVIDLEPGTALTWPMNQPHRVNNKTFCVSVTTEYSTVASGRRNAAMIANATLRAKFGANPSYWEASPRERYVKAVLGRVIKKVGIAHKVTVPDLVTFKLDPSAPDYLVDTDPYRRDF
ncbi:hypothetical protein [Fretibacter rubidus]|uniref:hypothetical protein n=1 Tax=Fretibacter rubidus TaxID=570162 RepID=UPI00352BCD76